MVLVLDMSSSVESDEVVDYLEKELSYKFSTIKYERRMLNSVFSRANVILSSLDKDFLEDLQEGSGSKEQQQAFNTFLLVLFLEVFTEHLSKALKNDSSNKLTILPFGLRFMLFTCLHNIDRRDYNILGIENILEGIKGICYSKKANQYTYLDDIFKIGNFLTPRFAVDVLKIIEEKALQSSLFKSYLGLELDTVVTVNHSVQQLSTHDQFLYIEVAKVFNSLIEFTPKLKKPKLVKEAKEYYKSLQDFAGRIPPILMRASMRTLNLKILPVNPLFLDYRNPDYDMKKLCSSVEEFVLKTKEYQESVEGKYNKDTILLEGLNKLSDEDQKELDYFQELLDNITRVKRIKV